MPVGTHFHADVRDDQSAESCLVSGAAGDYITYRVSDRIYVLSFVTPAGLISHLPLGRLSDGAWCIPEQAGTPVAYETLEALLASRKYLKLDEPAASNAENDATERDSSEEFPLPEPLPAAPAPGMLDADGNNDVISSSIVPPTCAPSLQRAIMMIATMVSICLVGIVWVARGRIGADMERFADDSRMAVASAARELHFELAQVLLPLHNGTHTELVEDTCGNAADTLVSGLCATQPDIQADLDELTSQHGRSFTAILLCMVAAALLSLGLLFVHTGRKVRMAIGNANASNPCTGMRVRWSLAFTCALLAFTLSTYTVLDAVWTVGVVPGEVFRAWQPLVRDAHSKRRKAVSLDTLTAQLGNRTLPWSIGSFGTAVGALGLTPACTYHFESRLGSSMANPPYLFIKLPLHLLPQQVWVDLPQSIQPTPKQLCLGSGVYATSENAWLQGPYFILPSQLGAARIAVTTVAATVGVLFGTLLLVEMLQNRRTQQQGAHLE